MKDKLKIKIWNYKNIVLYEVLEQDESLRNKGKLFTASNGLKIFSCDYPNINSGEIYIRGNELGTDELVSNLELESVKEAKKIVKGVNQAVKEFNESFNQILDKEEKEYLKAVIRPFRKRIRYIKKVEEENDNREFIGIQLEYEHIFLPYFEVNTMYKNMMDNKEYTLEELGL